MKIYFAGSIRGGRKYAKTYRELVAGLRRYGEVLTEHVADETLLREEKQLSDVQIFQRDVDWIRRSDVIVAEVSQPSLGVGYEIALAESLGKRVVCLFQKGAGRLSAMLTGNSGVTVIEYGELVEAWAALGKWLG